MSIVIKNIDTNIFKSRNPHAPLPHTHADSARLAAPLTRSTRTLQQHAQHPANSYKFPALKTSCNSVPVLQMKPPGPKPNGLAISTSPHTQPRPAERNPIEPSFETSQTHDLSLARGADRALTPRERTLQPIGETREVVKAPDELEAAVGRELFLRKDDRKI